MLSRENYLNVLNSGRFRQLSDLRKKISEYKCEICKYSNRELHTHHLSYDNLGNESLAEIVVLCDLCHLDQHCQEYKNRERRVAAHINGKWILFRNVKQILQSFEYSSIKAVKFADRVKEECFLLDGWKSDYTYKLTKKRSKARIGSKKAWHKLKLSNKEKLAFDFQLSLNQLYNAVCVEFRMEIIAQIQEILSCVIYHQARKKLRNK